MNGRKGDFRGVVRLLGEDYDASLIGNIRIRKVVNRIVKERFQFGHSDGYKEVKDGQPKRNHTDTHRDNYKDKHNDDYDDRYDDWQGSKHDDFWGSGIPDSDYPDSSASHSDEGPKRDGRISSGYSERFDTGYSEHRDQC